MTHIRRWIGIGVIVLAVLLAGAYMQGGTASGADTPQQTAAELPEGGAYADINGFSMYYEIHGAGEPVLLIHGSAQSTADFINVVPALMADYQTVLMDCRGRGRSSSNGDPLTYASMADDILALMDYLGLEKVHVVGWSDGAIIGLEMAIHHPERIAKLVSYGANFTVEGLRPEFLEMVNTITHEDFAAMLGEEYIANMPDPQWLDVMIEQLRWLYNTQPNYSLEELGSITSPVLVLDGEEEEAVRVEHARLLAAAIPGAELVLLPGTGHAAPYEKPDEFNAAAVAFLAGELDAPPAGKYAKVNDIDMYYESYGEGEPVLLIHSVTGSTAQFADVIPALAEQYQVIALDFRGHGRTTDSGLPLTYAQMAADVVALMDTLGIDSAHVVGNKDGGIIGLVMAQDYPERIRSLVTASVNWSTEGLQPWFVDYAKNATLADWDAMTGGMYRDLAPDPTIMPVMFEKVRNLLLMQPDFTLEELSEIDIPVLVLAGADEEVLILEHVEAMAEAISNAELVLIGEAGHGVLNEQTEAWMDAVNTFLAAQMSTSAYAHPEMLVDTAWLADHLSDPHLRILDTKNFLAEDDAAKRLANYEAGHIPGAVYVDARDDISDLNGDTPLLILPADEFEALMGRLGIGNETTVVVYDDEGNTWSARLWWAFRYYGHDNVKLLDGGLAKWTLEERPLERGINKPTPATFRAEVRTALLATKVDVLAAIDDPDVVIIDSLAPEFFSGEQNWPNMRAGHIPTAENVFVMDNLDPANLTLLPAQSLVELWQKVNLKPGQEIITYCGAGYYGAFNLFVLYQLGYDDVRLYDGSWMEWGADLTLPAEAILNSLATPTPDASHTVPRFEPAECMYSFPEGEQVECGYLVVPEDRAAPDAGTTRIYVQRFKSANPNPAQDPVVYMPGGPGASGPFYVFLVTGTPIGQVLRMDRDLILMEYRGATFSEPAFFCPEMIGDLAEFAAMSYREEIAWSGTALKHCNDRLVAEGHNLSAYHASAAAADVADLRTALGYDAVNVMGVSYGTPVLMELLRDHSEGIHSVILDSVMPPEVNYYGEQLRSFTTALNAVFTACAADPPCAAAYPELESRFYTALAQLRAEPVAVMVEQADQAVEVMVDDLMLVNFAYDTIFIADSFTGLPAALDAVASGDYQAVAMSWLGRVEGRHAAAEPGTGSWTWGLTHTMRCMREGSSLTSDQARADFAAADADPSVRDWAVVHWIDDGLAICDFWDVTPPQPNTAILPVTSDVPTLMLVGTFDPAMQPYFSAEAAGRFSNGYYHELPLGHGSELSGCALDLIAQFLADPTQAPDASCIDEMTLNWVLPE